MKIFNGNSIKPKSMPDVMMIKLYNFISFTIGKTDEMMYKTVCFIKKARLTPTIQYKKVQN